MRAFASSPTINFEEAVPQPDTVTSQYCNSAATSLGVEFLSGGGRIYSPSVAVASGTHALTNHFPGSEFGEYLKLDIGFTTGQSVVSVKVGLDKAHSFAVTATISAYSDSTPGTGFIDYGTAYLGTGPTAVTTPLSVSSSTANIRSVRIEFTGASPGQAAHELIDDLTFSTAGPACIEDDNPPSVQISQPDSDGKTVHVPEITLAFSATDNETGVAKIQVRFLDSTSAEVGAFYVCGGPGVPPCAYEVVPTKASYNFYTYLLEDTAAIQVKAWDFADHSASAQRALTYAPPGPNFNLWAMGMEITQAIQPWVAASSATRSSTIPSQTLSSESVNLVAGKRTVVRLYPGVEGTTVQVQGVQGTLACTDASGIPCPGKGSIQSQNSVTVDPLNNNQQENLRHDPAKTLNFVLPQTWTEWDRPVTLTATISPPAGVSECAGCNDGADSLRVSGIDFQETAPLNLHLVWACVRRNASDLTTACDHAPFDVYQDVFLDSTSRFVKVYPLALKDIRVTIHSPQWLPFDGDFNHPQGAMTSGRMYAYHDFIGNLVSSDTGTAAGSNPINLVYFGIVPVPVTAILGLGSRNVVVGKLDSASVFGDDLAIAAHEVGHALGRPHASCDHGEGGCESAPDVFPCTHGGICTYGFDTYTLQVIDPGNPPAAGHAHDLMSYGPEPLWISPYTYDHLFTALHGALGSSSLSKSDEIGPVAEGDRLYINGTISRSTSEVSAELSPFYHLPWGTARTDAGEGDFTVELLNSEDGVLGEYAFEPETVAVDPPDPETNPTEPFHLVVPFPEALARVVIKYRGTQIAERVRSPYPPAITSLSVAESEVWSGDELRNVTWESQDPDAGTSLSYQLLYATDGGTQWRTLVSDWNENSFDIDVWTLPGSDTAVLQVIATDGINTVRLLSPSFVVEKKPPMVRIVGPRTEEGVPTYLEGQTVVLEASATDLEDGPLSGETFSWQSDIQGSLGSGNRVDVDSLSPGLHEILVEAVDGDDQAGYDTVDVLIMERQNRQPVAVAGPDRLAGIGMTVVLNGSASYDPDGDALSYLWTIVDEPSGANPELADASTSQAGFTADVEGSYVLSLTVHDGHLGGLADTVTVEVVSEVPSPPDGVWKDVAVGRVSPTMNFYVQTYDTGSMVIVASPDGETALAFLDPDYSDGFDADDLGGSGVHLSASFETADQGSAEFSVPGHATVEYAIYRWFPASIDDSYCGIWKDEPMGVAGGMSLYVQTYEDSAIVIISPDARSFQVFLDPDKADGLDVDSMSGSAHMECDFAAGGTTEGMVMENGEERFLEFFQWFSTSIAER